MIKAKFYVSKIVHSAWNPGVQTPGAHIELQAVQHGSPENEKLWKHANVGRIEMDLTVSEVAEFFQCGDEYYVTFHRVNPEGDRTEPEDELIP